MPTTNVPRMTLREAADAVRARQLSPVELTRACLERIERLDPHLNAFITVTDEAALAAAARAEAEILAGAWRGPLHGIPIAIKDLFDTAGVRTTAASGVYRDRVPNEDAEVVRRLNGAGAISLGKLNMHEFAYGGTSHVSHFGPVRNPWNLDRIAGGSSGGSSAAVAAGLCYGAMGSDTGGSIRQPSALCGIVGLKPTYGRVSLRGVIPLSWSLDHAGPMTLTVADAAAFMDALAGYDPADVASVDAPVPSYASALDGPTAALRIGVPRLHFFTDLHPEVESAVAAAIAFIGSMTASTVDVELPRITTLREISGPVLTAEAHAYHAEHLATCPERYDPDTLERVRRGAAITTPAYIHARRELEAVRRAAPAVFDEVDLLITPTTPAPAPALAEVKGDIGITTLRNTSPFNAYGLPTISIPCGFSADGLPIGLQITGRPFDEPRVLRLAHAYEQATPWRHRLPSLIAGA
ncbi:MAG: amidase [Dehalococcoidia bacterium]